MKKGDKVVCLCEDYEWQLENFITPGGVPEKGKVYVIDFVYGYPNLVVGLNFVGGIICVSKAYRCITGFAPNQFRLLSEIQEEIKAENKRKEMYYANPS